MTISEIPSGWMLLFDNVVKATVVLGVAGAAAYTLRRASAALRHFIWTLALVSALVMPLLSMALPRWEMPIVTVKSASPVAGPIASEPDVAAPPRLNRQARCRERYADRHRRWCVDCEPILIRPALPSPGRARCSPSGRWASCWLPAACSLA